MPRFAANLVFQFNEVAFLDRFDAAARAGFTAVEYMFPYPYPEDALVERLERNGLSQVLHNMPAGDWDKGDRGIGCDPDRRGEFQESVGKTLEYATALRCPVVNCLAGVPPSGVGAAKARDTFVENLRFAAGHLGRAGITLAAEAINTYDVPGFFVHRTADMLAILEDVGAADTALLYDIYHMQRMEGELANTIRASVGRIAHMQLADNPGRNEPGTGEINYPFLFRAIDEAGYKGWIGCEYRPKAGTEAGLGWLSPYR